jgi:hypothetical protein
MGSNKDDYQALSQDTPEQQLTKIEKTLYWFWKHPWQLLLWYRFTFAFKELAILGRFFRRFSPPSDDRCDGTLYPVLRIIDQLGGKGYLKTLYQGFKQSQNSDQEKINDLHDRIKNIFDSIYAKNAQSIMQKLLTSNNRADFKKKALLLRLMPQFKARINRFARQHELEEIAFTAVTQDGDDENLPKKTHKDQLEEGILPAYRWCSTEVKDPSNEKAQHRQRKSWSMPAAKFFAFLVTAGQAMIGAYAVYDFAMIWIAPWAPLLTGIALVAGVITNYILFRGRTLKTFKEFFIHRDLSWGLKGVGGKIAAICVVLSSLAAGFLMGAISWIACMKLIPFPPLALTAAIILMIANLAAYSSLMYVSSMNLIKKVKTMLPKISTWWKDYRARLTNNTFVTVTSSVIFLLLCSTGMALLIFSLTSLLASWNTNVIQFFTQTLPPFMQVSTTAANILSITLVLGLAAVARAAFTFESIFRFMNAITDTIVEKCVYPLGERLGWTQQHGSALTIQEDTLQFSDFWKHPLKTTLRWGENIFKGFAVFFNGVAFAALGMMGYERLGIIGIDDKITAEIGSFGSTAFVSWGANSGGIWDAEETKPGQAPIYPSPIDSDSQEKREEADSIERKKPTATAGVPLKKT